VIPRRQYCTSSSFTPNHFAAWAELTLARLKALSRRAASARLRRLSPTLRSRLPIFSVCRFIVFNVSQLIFLCNSAPAHSRRQTNLRVRHDSLVTPCWTLSSLQVADSLCHGESELTESMCSTARDRNGAGYGPLRLRWRRRSCARDASGAL
jgi:hypothetical protein